MDLAAPRRAGRNLSELLTGAVVLVVLAGMLAVAVVGKDRPSEGGYLLNANFAHVDGLSVGSDVRLAGITVGHVTQATVDPHTFRAKISFTVRPDIKLPSDSAAIITSDSLLGGKYIALSPGGGDQNLKAGGSIAQTQGSISLEQLLSKFIFTVTDTMTRANQAHDSSKAGDAAAKADGLQP